MKLINKKNQMEICPQLKNADSFMSRLIGLIGTKDLTDKGMMFEGANWIHTTFMSIPIDVVYVDKHMKIVKIDHSLRPWRFAAPVFKARTAIELQAGLAQKKQLTVGDELYVGH